MDQYNEAMDKIGEAIIGWADATGKWTADREVSVHVSVGYVLCLHDDGVCSVCYLE